jgi:hypothetical protein
MFKALQKHAASHSKSTLLCGMSRISVSACVCGSRVGGRVALGI